ncbi:UNVERIFIED_CONTAM: hypothetical protein FKN15_062029 [Acipenser sinensis]
MEKKTQKYFGFDPRQSEILLLKIEDDPDYIPKPEELDDDQAFELLEYDGDVFSIPSCAPSSSGASPCTSSAQPPKKRQRKGKCTLVAVSQRHPETARDSAWTLSTLIPTPSHRQRMWKKADTPMFQVPDPVFDVPDSVKSPYQFFKMLFTDQMTEHITEQTNLYSAQELASSINTNPGEIQEFLSLLLYMGVFQFPSLDDYWYVDSRFLLVADVMPVKGFRLLSMCIHFNDNTQYNNSLGCFFKIRPIFDMLHQQCLLIPPTYKQSVDEVMVAYKGTRAGNLWQYTANKPDKWGYKLFCQASSSGVIHDFLLYQGSSTFFNIGLTETEQDLLMRAKVVTTLCKTIEQPESTVVYCDNYFTSFNLLQTLHTNLGIRCSSVE